MHIVIKPVDVRSIQAVIVVAADEYLVTYGSSKKLFRKSIASRSLPTNQICSAMNCDSHDFISAKKVPENSKLWVFLNFCLL